MRFNIYTAINHCYECKRQIKFLVFFLYLSDKNYFNANVMKSIFYYIKLRTFKDICHIFFLNTTTDLM